MMGQERTTWNWRGRLVPLLIDLATFAGYLFFVPWFGEQIYFQSAWNHLFLIAGFVLIIAGTIAIRQLPSYSIDEENGPSVLGTCLVFFLLIAYLILYTYATNIGGSAKRNENIGVFLFFVLLFPFLGAFCVPLTRAQPETRRARVAEWVGLFSVNYLTLIGASLWSQFSSLPTKEDPVYATGLSFLVLFGILYLLFLVFFGLPRIYLLRATGDRIGLTIYLAGLAIYLWDKVPPVN
ncbi:MAG: hypothetical protein ACR2RV_17850 [Verrucomicrobiales bacterium]